MPGLKKYNSFYSLNSLNMNPVDTTGTTLYHSIIPFRDYEGRKIEKLYYSTQNASLLSANLSSMRDLKPIPMDDIEDSFVSARYSIPNSTVQTVNSIPTLTYNGPINITSTESFTFSDKCAKLIMTISFENFGGNMRQIVPVIANDSIGNQTFADDRYYYTYDSSTSTYIRANTYQNSITAYRSVQPVIDYIYVNVESTNYLDSEFSDSINYYIYDTSTTNGVVNGWTIDSIKQWHKYNKINLTTSTKSLYLMLENNVSVYVFNGTKYIALTNEESLSLKNRITWHSTYISDPENANSLLGDIYKKELIDNSASEYYWEPVEVITYEVEYDGYHGNIRYRPRYIEYYEEITDTSVYLGTIYKKTGTDTYVAINRSEIDADTTYYKAVEYYDRTYDSLTSDTDYYSEGSVMAHYTRSPYLSNDYTYYIASTDGYVATTTYNSEYEYYEQYSYTPAYYTDSIDINSIMLAKKVNAQCNNAACETYVPYCVYYLGDSDKFYLNSNASKTIQLEISYWNITTNVIDDSTILDKNSNNFFQNTIIFDSTANIVTTNMNDVFIATEMVDRT